MFFEYALRLCVHSLGVASKEEVKFGEYVKFVIVFQVLKKLRLFINKNYTRGGSIKCKIEKAMIFHIVLTSFP